jgi:hypothetical protein
MPTKTHTKAATRRTLKPTAIASSGHEAPQAAPSSLTRGDVEILTEDLRAIQRLVRICYAAGAYDTEEFQQEIADTLGEEVLDHVSEALELLEKTSPGSEQASEPGGGA